MTAAYKPGALTFRWLNASLSSFVGAGLRTRPCRLQEKASIATTVSPATVGAHGRAPGTTGPPSADRPYARDVSREFPLPPVEGRVRAATPCRAECAQRPVRTSAPERQFFLSVCIGVHRWLTSMPLLQPPASSLRPSAARQHSGAESSPKATAWDWALFALLALAALLPPIAAGGSDFTYADASRHAMDGVFVLDAIKAHPFSHPFEWAKEYYLTSPALGFGRYPPLFALIEAPFYAILGITPLAGRLAGGFLWLAGLVFFYEALRGFLGRPGAAIAALTLAAGPASVIWSGEVMLELPATAFMLTAACVYSRYIENHSRRWLTLAIAVACLAGWVKQPAALAAIAIVLHFLLTRQSPKPLRELLPGVVITLILLVPLAALSLAFGKANVDLLSGVSRTYPFSESENWLCYVRQIPAYYLGWPLTIFAFAGAAFALFRRNVKSAGFWFLWIVVFYAFFTFVGYKTPRLAMLWTPGLAFFAGVGFSEIARSAHDRKSSLVRPIAVSLLAAVSLILTYAFAWQSVPRQGSEIAEVAARTLQTLPERILYSGPQNGTFIFRIRELAGVTRPTVVRDSKVLYSEEVQFEMIRNDHIRSSAALRETIASLSPDAVVMERGGAYGAGGVPQVVELLAAYLSSPDFELLDTVSAPPVTFEIFRYRGPKEHAPVDVPMPGVGMQLQLPAGK